MVNLRSLRWPKYTQLGTIFPKKSCSTIKLFFFKYVLFETVLSKYLKKIGGHRARLREKENLFRYRPSLVWGKSLAFCGCTCPCVYADDVKIVCSRDAQCNTKELPWAVWNSPPLVCTQAAQALSTNHTRHTMWHQIIRIDMGFSTRCPLQVNIFLRSICFQPRSISFNLHVG